MPELPEVEMVVRTLSPRVTGRRVARTVHVRGDMLAPAAFELSHALKGRTIERVSRRGKRIVFHLDDGNLFFIHLGMTGRLSVEPCDAERAIHTHLILDIGGGEEMRFRDPRRFGEIRWLGCEMGDQNMGPEPLAMRVAQLAARLSKTRRAIKNALMDQNTVAGLGNIYVDESLFAAGIHPLTPAHELTTEQVRRLAQSIKRVLRRAIRHRGSTLRDYVDAEGGKGAFQRLHNVYGRAGDPCRRCGTPVQRIVLGGRSTHFCAKCQRAPATVGSVSPRLAKRGTNPPTRRR
jgi:formamidopyrimidine-DNA glycosylase